MTHAYSHAEVELEILEKTTPDNVVTEFKSEILAICEAFGKSGQSGGSAPYVANAIANAIKRLCLQETIAPLTGESNEWGTVADGLNQNNRESAVFKNESERAYYLDAIIWQGEDGWDSFTGTVEGITSRQFIKSFPFIPKRFRIDVYRVPYNRDKHNIKDAISCGNGDYVYFIKDRKQLDAVFKYYDKYEECLSK